jgi:hypothetical protein
LLKHLKGSISIYLTLIKFLQFAYILWNF